MQHTNENLKIQQVYWNKMYQFKFDLIYYSLYFNLCVSIMRLIKYISVGLTVLVTGIWMNWYNIQSVSVSCAIVILIIQAFNALSELFPFDNRKLEIREMSNELDNVYLQMEADWLKISDGELTITEITSLIQTYAKKRADIEKHYFKNDSLPYNKRIDNHANDKVESYFKNF